MTTNLLSVIEQQHKALNICIAKHYNLAEDVRIGDAIAAGQQALEQAQVEPAPLSHLKTKTGAPPEQGAITSVNGSEPAPEGCAHCHNPLDALTKTCEGLGLYEADFEPAPSTAVELTHPTPEMQLAGGDVRLDNGIGHALQPIGWLTAARVWIAMEKVRLASARSQPVREPLKGDSNAVP